MLSGYLAFQLVFSRWARRDEIASRGRAYATTVQAPYRQRERSFDLQVMGGASAASRLLVELRCPLLWQRFEGQAFGSGPDFMAVGPVAFFFFFI